ncbi:hypothetical protein [Actinokineospora diospyrosa]|uniref:DDE family transposase n=1 Tax=Actinokineospora diospyrosa TaxID=103728 RepID=A0ABT1I8W0_9PSEU|nr:hypothetical protein [Actinokineospora diospyrosa]MCP2269067.1 hypothetical protein [Actinokineospora diospyrosa]
MFGIRHIINGHAGVRTEYAWRALQACVKRLLATPSTFKLATNGQWEFTGKGVNGKLWKLFVWDRGYGVHKQWGVATVYMTGSGNAKTPWDQCATPPR